MRVVSSGGVPTWVALLIALAVGGLMIAAVGKRYAVIDPRSGEHMAPPAGWAAAIVLTCGVLVVAAIAVVVRLTG